MVFQCADLGQNDFEFVKLPSFPTPCGLWWISSEFHRTQRNKFMSDKNKSVYFVADAQTLWCESLWHAVATCLIWVKHLVLSLAQTMAAGLYTIPPLTLHNTPVLNHWDLVTHVCVSELSHHWLRYWPAVCSELSHYLNQSWRIVSWANFSEIRITIQQFENTTKIVKTNF